MGYGYQQPYHEPRRRRSWGFTCLVTLVILVFVLLALVVGALVYLKPRLSQGAGDTLGGQLDAMINEKVGGLEGVGGQLPAGFNEQIIITEDDINQYIAANPEEIAPLDSVSVQFIPGEMQATVNAYGFGGTARSGVAATNGRMTLVDPRIEGPLSYIIDPQQLAQSLETRLNQELESSGGQVTAVEVQDGQIVATIESTQ